MTVLLVLRWGGLRVTLARTVARCAGTLLGAGFVTLAVPVLRPGPPARMTLGMLAVWVCYATQWANYAFFRICITTYVVCAIALPGLREPFVAGHRAAATALGGLVALIGQIATRGSQAPCA